MVRVHVAKPTCLIADNFSSALSEDDIAVLALDFNNQSHRDIISISFY